MGDVLKVGAFRVCLASDRVAVTMSKPLQLSGARSFSEYLSPAEARELAAHLNRAADEAEPESD